MSANFKPKDLKEIPSQEGVFDVEQATDASNMLWA